MEKELQSRSWYKTIIKQIDRITKKNNKEHKMNLETIGSISGTGQILIRLAGIKQERNKQTQSDTKKISNRGNNSELFCEVMR